MVIQLGSLIVVRGSLLCKFIPFSFHSFSRFESRSLEMVITSGFGKMCGMERYPLRIDFLSGSVAPTSWCDCCKYVSIYHSIMVRLNFLWKSKAPSKVQVLLGC